MLFFFSSRRRHTRFSRDWSSDVCSSDLGTHLYDQGTNVNLLAMPEKGWDFEGWFIDGEFYSDNPSTSIIINADMTAMAVFAEERSEERRVGKEWSRRGPTYINIEKE